VAAGLVSLRIVSPVERAVDIEGLHSCTTDAQCPEGQRCRTDLTCN
jgi:Cys-rich repeat protein